MKKSSARGSVRRCSFGTGKRQEEHQIDLKATGANIGRLIGRKGISIRQLSEDIGLGSVQSVYRWLRGINLPDADNLIYLSRYFGVSIDEIIEVRKENGNAGI